MGLQSDIVFNVMIETSSGRIVGQENNDMNGGHSWDRTNDLPIKSRLLYQLSYVPIKGNLVYLPAPVQLIK